MMRPRVVNNLRCDGVARGERQRRIILPAQLLAMGLLASTACPAPPRSEDAGRNSPSSASLVPTLELLEAAIPARAARVIGRARAIRAGTPIVVIVRDAHINADLPPGFPAMATPTYTAEQRAVFGAVALEVLRVEEALLGAGLKLFGAEAIDKPIDGLALAQMAVLLPDMAALMAAPLAGGARRARAERILARGSNLNAALVLAAVHQGTARIVGVETMPVIERMLDVADRLTRLEQLTADRGNSFGVLRTGVLAGVATRDERAAYAGHRDTGLALLQEFDHFLIRERSQVMADGAVKFASAEGAAAVAVVAGGFHSETLAAAAAASGAGYLVVEPTSYSRAARPYPVWLAEMRTRLPPAPGTTAPARSRAIRGALPSLDPWIQVLSPYAQALAQARALPAIRAAVIRPPPPLLAPDDPLRQLVQDAAARLGKALPRARLAASAMGDDVPALIGSIALRGSPPRGWPMSFDALHGCLKVAQWVDTLHPDELAAVLAHELVHVADNRRLAAGLRLPQPEVALVLDALSTATGVAWQVHVEDRAFRAELDVAAALGIQLPGPKAAKRMLSDPNPRPADRVRATLGALAAALDDPSTWIRTVGEGFPTK